ncbi:MAG: sugar kinase [Veillonellales bacterium]
MPEVITIGESMVMMVADQSDSLQFVTSYTRKIAGADSNVAIGLARLGHEAGWISALGDDPFGTYIRNTIRGEGVDTSQVAFSAEYPTGLLVKELNEIGDPKVYYYRKGSAASHIKPDILNENYFFQAKLLHITGIFPALSPNCLETVLQAIKLAKRKGLMVSFDPNIRLQLWTREQARETLMQIAALSDLILPGSIEAEIMAGTTAFESVADIFHKLGVQYVVMKDGSRGAHYSCAGDNGNSARGYEKGFPVKRVVDTVGAGDGFAVGVLSGLLENISLKEAVIRGNAIGSLAVKVRGDVEGYPTKKQLEEYLQTRKDI